MRAPPHPLALAAALLLLAPAGCGLLSKDEGYVSPYTFTRNERRGLNKPPPPFDQMDLPYFGGMIEHHAEGYMEVTYRREATAEEIITRWPAALEAEGWVSKAGGSMPDGGFSGLYDTPDGKLGQLAIHPLGSLWVVELTVTKLQPLPSP